MELDALREFVEEQKGFRRCLLNATSSHLSTAGPTETSPFYLLEDDLAANEDMGPIVEVDDALWEQYQQIRAAEGALHDELARLYRKATE
jgi:hypothetical protein